MLISTFNKRYSLRVLVRGFHKHKSTGDRVPNVVKTVVGSNEAATPDENKLIKRKVALVCSFVGTSYKGMQYNPLISTIEGTLMESMSKTGLILPTNMDINRLKWSRSSRTDKGVHAARVIVGTNMEIHPKWLKNTSFSRISEVPQLLNSVLPEDIRVFSCIKMNPKFNARSNVSWREYEYLIPLDILTHTLPSDYGQLDHMKTTPTVEQQQQYPDQPPEYHLAKLNAQLKKMVGCHSFHNFHRDKTVGKEKRPFLDSRSRANLTPRGEVECSATVEYDEMTDTPAELLDMVNSDPEVVFPEDPVDKILSSSSALQPETDPVEAAVKPDLDLNGNPRYRSPYDGASAEHKYFADWVPADERVVNRRTSSVMYRVDAQLFDVPMTQCTGSGEKEKKAQKMIRITITGQSFLLQ